MLSAESSVVVVENKTRSDKRVCCCPNRGEREYQVLAHGARRLYTAKEELDCCCQRCGCLFRRDFKLRVVNSRGEEAYRLDHPTMCCSWLSCCACCRHRLRVSKPGGDVVGTVGNDCRLCCTCFPRFTVKDSTGARMYQMTKNVNCMRACCANCRCCGCVCTVPAGYSIEGIDSPTGNRKNSAGTFQKMEDARSRLDNEDSFSLTFPPSASEDERVLLVATAILADYTLYESRAASASTKTEKKATPPPAMEMV